PPIYRNELSLKYEPDTDLADCTPMRGNRARGNRLVTSIGRACVTQNTPIRTVTAAIRCPADDSPSGVGARNISRNSAIPITAPQRLTPGGTGSSRAADGGTFMSGFDQRQGTLRRGTGYQTGMAAHHATVLREITAIPRRESSPER